MKNNNNEGWNIKTFKKYFIKVLFLIKRSNFLYKSILPYIFIYFIIIFTNTSFIYFCSCRV